MSKNKRIGKIGENLAKDYLVKEGYFILKQNYFSPFGEIDIIAEKSDCLYFIEVKTRTSKIFGLGFESINRRKFEKIQKTAEIYMTDNGWSGLVQLIVISILYHSREQFSIELMLVD